MKITDDERYYDKYQVAKAKIAELEARVEQKIRAATCVERNNINNVIRLDTKIVELEAHLTSKGIDKLADKVDEQAAHIERLKSKVKQWINTNKYPEVLEELNSIPTQSLAHIQADGIREMLDDTSLNLQGYVQQKIHDYATKLRGK